MHDVVIAEFQQLATRYNQALEYEKAKYMTDLPDGKEWAEKEIRKLVVRMNELWMLMTKDEQQNCINMIN